MQRKINTDQQITNITESKFFIGADDKDQENKSECIFQKPVRQISGSGKSADPYQKKGNDEYP